ncbi:MAG: hypothetical protein PF440_07875 [Thiomicrorhabdus sp.]|jgi:hypothetical protein|nr:hypothetical protein [Thiomicrorhabdus sp.]
MITWEVSSTGTVTEDPATGNFESSKVNTFTITIAPVPDLTGDPPDEPNSSLTVDVLTGNCPYVINGVDSVTFSFTPVILNQAFPNFYLRYNTEADRTDITTITDVALLPDGVDLIEYHSDTLRSAVSSANITVNGTESYTMSLTVMNNWDGDKATLLQIKQGW